MDNPRLTVYAHDTYNVNIRRKTMLLRLIGGLVITVVIVGALFMIAMRTKSSTLQKPIKAMNKNLWNPRALKDAGQADAQWSVIHHVGRTSGTSYATPVGMYATDDALFVVLPYGTNTDWYKNLAAAGGGTAVHKGITYEFTTPEVVPTSEILDILPDNEHGNLKTFDIDKTLRLPVKAAIPLEGETRAS